MFSILWTFPAMLWTLPSDIFTSVIGFYQPLKKMGWVSIIKNTIIEAAARSNNSELAIVVGIGIGAVNSLQVLFVCWWRCQH